MEPLHTAICENDPSDQKKLLAILQKSKRPVKS